MSLQRVMMAVKAEGAHEIGAAAIRAVYMRQALHQPWPAASMHANIVLTLVGVLVVKVTVQFVIQTAHVAHQHFDSAIQLFDALRVAVLHVHTPSTPVSGDCHAAITHCQPILAVPIPASLWPSPPRSPYLDKLLCFQRHGRCPRPQLGHRLR